MLCKQRIMLTGTPLQNDLQELQNLLGFLLPDVFKDDAAAHLADVQVKIPLHLAYPWHAPLYLCSSLHPKLTQLHIVACLVPLVFHTVCCSPDKRYSFLKRLQTCTARHCLCILLSKPYLTALGNADGM